MYQLEPTASHPKQEHWASLQMVFPTNWNLEEGGRDTDTVSEADSEEG